MAINNVNGGGPKAPLENKITNQQSQNQTEAQQQAANKAAVTAQPRQDSVSLTQSAQQLNQVQKRASEAPVNQEKVDKLKKAIQSGQYRIDPDSMARKIARLEAQVFGIKS
ncbi:flagellar biosynthesis anti-sigma factor FlgM [Alteromonas aestuariivivens]|uniref:Negative regulator of flagellin synthesis n=1 Tax=Alteromonas aestuariivivens TaxID=1938339 RepID=A0A3D8M609_9ALTE|nr:flagellar biosynthesis anti-sigma factor FlgM [Alteromonas aestuariivivens]RDV25020.1 flagellar biosynthesis anti-sigma factor FlgM [Alteromonas aestuariivivens]